MHSNKAIHLSNLANLLGLKLPKCFTKTNLFCQQCFLPWSFDTCSVKLLPVKKLKKSSSKTKVDSSKTGLNLEVSRNHLVLKCKICKSRSHFYLPKTIKINEIVVKQDENKIERKNKKKKKDKNCGLRIPLNKSFNKYESPPSSKNNDKNSNSKPSKAANSTAIINRNVQQTNLQVKNSQSVPQLPVRKIQKNVRNKNLSINPHTSNLKSKTSKKKNNSLKNLQKMIQGQKEPIKKTLKDFLTLI